LENLKGVPNLARDFSWI